ncbi:TetR family transcriptional regulator [Williamsia herbipolensis]|uniref:TetR family transcriptional regulator n=1 Tax=Williamsia herbipolensis TaxID=1603258 RepID=A0AAU4JY80_9NOCA|nr:TetR family transcriptional regulator [Williamsia herbipolensis]
MAYRRTPAVQRRLDELRARLIDAAIAQVAEHGYAGCSVASVAAAAGVGTGTVYRHFEGKSELFAEVFRIVCGREVQAMVEIGEMARATDGRAVDAVVASVCAFADRALRTPTLAHALLVEPVDQTIDTERLAFRTSFRDNLSVAIDAAADAGEIPNQNSEFTAACIVGAIGEALVTPLARSAHTHETPDPTTLTTDITTFTLRALGSTDAQHTRGHQSGSAAGGLRRG